MARSNAQTYYGKVIMERMRRYAFIDVSNTTNTTKAVLGFAIDWQKLYEHLVNEKWSCTGVFFYKGHKGEKEKEALEKLAEIGYVVRTKLTFVHSDTEREKDMECPLCKKTYTHKYVVKGHHKSNCDVELSVDAIEVLKEGDEAMLFTGDGDFSYLVERLLAKGVTVRIISSQNRDYLGKPRFSTRLKSIIEREEAGQKRVQFIHIKNWQRLIEKKEVGA